jgi:excinuclease ABC subunit A
MRAVAASEWVIDIGPGAGEEGGHVVASDTPTEVSKAPQSRTAPYLARFLNQVENESAKNQSDSRVSRVA